MLTVLCGGSYCVSRDGGGGGGGVGQDYHYATLFAHRLPRLPCCTDLLGTNMASVIVVTRCLDDAIQITCFSQALQRSVLFLKMSETSRLCTLKDKFHKGAKKFLHRHFKIKNERNVII